VLRLRLAAGIGALLVTAPAVFAAATPPARVNTMRLVAEADVNATPTAVWSWITTGKNLVTWCPVWKSAQNTKVQIDKVGDVLDFTDEWGNGGRSVVTFLTPGKELRVAHEPDNGKYMCQSKLMLSPTSSTVTHVTYMEQYTEEQAADVADKNASGVQTQMQATLDALKVGVEGAAKK